MLVITISRGSLSGGSLLARKLGERLGLRVISREMIIEVAQKYGVSEAELSKGLDSPPRLWERLIGKRERYILAIQAALAEMIEDGDVIYHGIVGQILLKQVPNVLKVRLIAPLEDRVRVAMSEEGITYEDAEKYIKHADMVRTQWVRRLYNVEWADPELYDLVVNLAHMDIDTAVESVVSLAKSPHFQSTDAARQKTKDFALATRVRAALKFKSDFAEDGVEAHADNGIVHLGGSSFAANHGAIIRFVKGISGVAGVIPDEDEDARDADPDGSHIDQTAADVMVPLQRYPHIHEAVTIREAMMALGASSVVLEDGHLLTPRYVLVFDSEDRLVGVIGRRNLLRGLVPHLSSIQRAKESVESMAPLADFSMPVSLRWNSLVSHAAASASWQPVKSVMGPIRGTVRSDDTLSTVVTAMIHHAIDLVPVIDGERVVGVVLMTDVFDKVAQFIMEQGAANPGR